MKRTFVIALAAGAMVLGLAGCGSDTKSASTESNGVRQESSTAVKTSAATSSVVTPPVEPPAHAATTTAAAKKTTAPNGAKTTCGEFRDLDEATEKAVITQILNANPGSALDGSPNVALGTAKLACLSAGYANTPVAVAIRVSK
ncbi:hypothetical protein LTV02_33750 [Nocardia yamanashiensis]|uniref:hypothetical protein n=1 Tax=Nocardia yamanashiensis TaxID=209247 RepID=UPI00082B241A|nr:hypothetical protein [Nocardia yamanashiensis]UGT40887.1 hypothetical protein LTV02_33750 [Nocardia yamanashiensis]